jgi:rhomboid family GlyGly-CTERM serine protease
VHASFIHTVWNVIGLWLAFIILLDAASPRDFAILLLASTVAIGVGLLAFAPDIGLYIGFSGTTHGLYAGGALLLMVRGRPWFGLLVLAVILAKIGYEQLYGPVPVSSGALGEGIATEAHLFGTVGGLIAGAPLALLRLRRQRRRPA